jgi:hypothetical protein
MLLYHKSFATSPAAFFPVKAIMSFVNDLGIFFHAQFPAKQGTTAHSWTLIVHLLLFVSERKNSIIIL